MSDHTFTVGDKVKVKVDGRTGVIVAGSMWINELTGKPSSDRVVLMDDTQQRFVYDTWMLINISEE